jgi:hypothetical protein
MAVTVPAIGATVLFNQGTDQTTPALASGGALTVPAIVLSNGGVGGLVVTVFALTPHNDHGVASGVQHSTVAPFGLAARSWSWPPASGNSNL